MSSQLAIEETSMSSQMAIKENIIAADDKDSCEDKHVFAAGDKRDKHVIADRR